MISKITEMLFDNDVDHPLDLDKADHRTKEIELKEKQSQLRDRADKLEEKLDQKKEQYFHYRDQGDKKQAERLQRDAEDIQDELETVQTKLNTLDQMLNTVSNFQNMYELRELGEDSYWERIRRLDRSELVSRFSQEKKSLEEIMGDLEDISIISEETISDLKTESDRLHSQSSLGWEEEYSEKTTEPSDTVPEAFSTDVDAGKDVDDVDLDDLNLS